MKGRIFSTQSFCVDDGPGIRSCVYLKGCNMRCAWCHNPESLSSKIETSYIANRCIGCRQCAQVCSAHSFVGGVHYFNHTSCHCNGADTKHCPTGALSLIGRDVEAADLLQCLATDRRYFDRSGGGITLTGGEPMLQPQFVRDFLEQAGKAGIKCCIETNGLGVEKITLPYLHLLMFFFGTIS